MRRASQHQRDPVSGTRYRGKAFDKQRKFLGAAVAAPPCVISVFSVLPFLV
jgi:hypothetical protein